MRTAICDQLGIAHPIFAFTPSEHVAAAVSRAGGLGVLGCVRFNDADELDAVLSWMDENTDGKPYGVDIVMPAKIPDEGTADRPRQVHPGRAPRVRRRHPAQARRAAAAGRRRSRPRDGVLGWLHSVARAHVDVALQHPIKLIANALGSPPKDVIDLAHAHGVPVAALAGKAKHARSHVDNGVDIVIAQGTEAGGHTGEIATMVLVPEIVDAVGADAHVLAAGGIGSGPADRRRARARRRRRVDGLVLADDVGVLRSAPATRCSGRWSRPARTRPCARASTAASRPGCSRRSGPRRGPRPARPTRCRCRCRTCWSARRTSGSLRADDPEVVAMPVGQIVGRMNAVRPVADLIAELVAEFDETLARLDKLR